MNSHKYAGKVKFFNVTKGYGFIVNNETKEEIFFHSTKVIGMQPKQEDDVEFAIGTGKKPGTTAAIDVMVV